MRVDIGDAIAHISDYPLYPPSDAGKERSLSNVATRLRASDDPVEERHQTASPDSDAGV